MALESISRIVTRLAKEQPDRPAVTCEERTVTRAELDRSSNRLARQLAALGVGQDARVMLALPNGIEFYETTLAIWKLGATPQPVSARLTRPELQAIAALTQPALILGVEPEWLPGHPVLPAALTPEPAVPDTPLPDRVARHWKAMPSGGSTGRPKIIVANVPGAFDVSVPWLLRHLPDRVHVVPGPLYHNGPFLSSFQGLFLGNHQVVLRRFDAEHALQALAQWRADWVLLVPTMMHRIWRLGAAVHARYDLSALRMMLHLAAPCPAWLKEAWIGWLGPERVQELYAGTEVVGVTWIGGEEWLRHRGSVGRPLPGFAFRILDEQGQPVPTGEVGEVYMRPLPLLDAPQQPPERPYHYDGAESRRRGEWESLGDMGWLDAEGYLYLADRRTDMILCGGANIYPAEIEAALDAHPAVRSSAVIGLPDEDLGNRVHAIVDTVRPVSEEALRAHLAERLTTTKLPRSFEWAKQPLRDDAGKVRRSALRAERIAAAETQQQR